MKWTNLWIKFGENGVKKIGLFESIISNKKYNKEQQSNNKKKYKIYLQCIFCFCYRFIEGRSTRTAGLSQGGPTWRWIIGDYP